MLKSIKFMATVMFVLLGTMTGLIFGSLPIASNDKVLRLEIVGMLIICAIAYIVTMKGIKSMENLVQELKKSQQELKESEQKIRHQAFYDSLTGLSNRERLNRVLLTAVEKTIDNDHRGAVLYIDLDNFKTINDTMGHSIGDKVLVEIADRFNKLVSFNKFFFRIGGDEFVAIIHGATNTEPIEEFSHEIIKILEEQVTIGSKSFNITASVGVAIFPHHGMSVEELLKKADMAMYKAKENGKNGYQIFDDSMQTELVTKVTLEEGIRKAMINDEFLLYYQPQYDIKQGKIKGMEVLLRWFSPSLGWVPPLQAIKIAEETGLIVKLEKWIFKNACLFAAKINGRVTEQVKISVNISAVHIMQSNFVDTIKSIITETKVDCRWIELEITETAMMESFESNKKKLQELRQLGIGIHLDDFGSGYSSLNYLQNLPIDYVKIDKIFIASMLNSERDSRITATIVELAHTIGLKVIAEGVENKEQFDQLGSFGCDIIQGYYIGKPMPEEAIVGMLKAG